METVQSNVITRPLIGMTSLEFSNEIWCVMLFRAKVDLGKITKKFDQNYYKKKLVFEKM